MARGLSPLGSATYACPLRIHADERVLSQLILKMSQSFDCLRQTNELWRQIASAQLDDAGILAVSDCRFMSRAASCIGEPDVPFFG